MPNVKTSKCPALALWMLAALSFHPGLTAVASLPPLVALAYPAAAQDGSFPLWEEVADDEEAGDGFTAPGPQDELRGAKPKEEQAQGSTSESTGNGGPERAEPLGAESATGSSVYFEAEPVDDIETMPSMIEVPLSQSEVSDLDWSLFSQGRRAELRARLIERQIDNPGRPISEDLLRELDFADARARFKNAVDSGQYRLADSIIAERDDLLGCDDIWFSWAAVEAFANLGRQERAISLARRMSAECDIPETDLRAGMLRLADQVDPATMTEIIDAMGTYIPASLADDLSRVAARQHLYHWIGLQDAEYERRKQEAGREHVGEDNIQNLVQRRFPEVEVTDAARDAVRVLEERRTWADPRDRSVLGWFYYHSGDFEKAASLFSTDVDGYGPELRRDFAIAETWAHLQNEDFLEAEAVLPGLDHADPDAYLEMNPYLVVARALVTHTHRPEGDKNNAGIWDLPSAVHERVAKVARTRNDPTLLQQLGWLEQRSCRCGPAIEWFDLALAADESQEDAAWGLAMCLFEEDRTKRLEELRREWADISPRIAGLIPHAGGRLLTIPRARPAAVSNAAYRAPVTGAALDNVIVGALRIERDQIDGCWPSGPVGSGLFAASGAPASEASAPPSPRTEPAAPVRVAQARVARAQPDPAPAPVRTRASVAPRTQPQSSARTQAQPQPRSAQVRRVSSTSCTPGANPRGMSPASALDHGWCLMELERPFEAIAAFERAAQSSNNRVRQDANYGRSLAYLRKGLPAQADASIRSSNNAPERFVEISSATVTENALAAYRAKNYVQAAALLEQRQSMAPMTTDLLVLLGWSYEKTGRLSAARQLWQAAAQAGSSDAAQALLTTE